MSTATLSRPSTTTVLSTVAAIAVATSVAQLVRNKQKPKTEEEDDPILQDPSITTIPLLPFDELFITRGVAPVATISWFEGNHQEAATHLKRRLQEVLQKNPWLRGKLVQKRSTGRYFLVYSQSDSSRLYGLDQLFVHLPPEQSPIHADIAIEDLHDACVNAPPGEEKVVLQQFQDMSQPVLRLTVVPCKQNPDNKFAVFLSLSHAVGDGHCFYQLYNMLMCGGGRRDENEVYALVPDRVEDTQELQEKALGIPEGRFMGSPIFASAVFKGIFQLSFGAMWGSGTKPSEAKVYMVDHDKMDKMKKEALDHPDCSVPFVSTNDICTSWLLRNSGCPYGIMWLNFRNRLKGHTDTHAGNYENVLFYRNPQDSQHAHLIRQSLQSMKRAKTGNVPISNWQHLGQNCCLVTNWSSFSDLEKVNVPGCKLVVSYPYFDLHQMLPTVPYGVIFEAKPKQLGIILMGPSFFWNGMEKPPFAR